MNLRILASIPPDRLRPARRGFTLIELLVVMGVIAILMSLTAAGVMAWMNGNARNITQTEVQGLQAILMQHWSAVVDSARHERLWNSDGLPNGDNSPLLAMADNDKERARVLLIKIRLMEKFPVNFTEVPAPGNDRYASAPLSWIPTKKRHQAYGQGYQSLIYDPNLNAPRWKTSNLTLKESVESAVCLWAALSIPTEGINTDTDQLQAWMKDVDGSGNKVLADAWGMPLRFYRFPTSNTDLNLVAPLGIVMPTAVDPLDTTGKLLNWPPPPAAASANATLFDNTIHKRLYTNTTSNMTLAQYAIPVIVSAGPDGKFGLPAVEPRTVTNMFPGAYGSLAPWQDMTVQSTSDEADNIYSYKKQGS